MEYSVVPMDITLQREKMAYVISLEIEIAMQQCKVYVGPTGWTAQNGLKI